ncbi:MAG TPA: sensor domain-containing diguanylate cyclase [Desulfitobacterium dehalogenans]|uniref:Sensor domain-containing diguanylate cyclase n=1 Tax=Desulfitobacterium dehalogenans TaxID=36854 RepID=A0A7C7DAN5_9FIRM|nr:sensor domain-containing diguanylate cyclase [Desulfitobacterium dehalogenans]
MNKWMSVFNNLDIGILILDEEFKIIYANRYLLGFIPFRSKEVQEQPLYEVLPKFHNTYIEKVLLDCLNNGSKMFLSAGLHKHLLHSDYDFNIKISRFEEGSSKLLLLEFIDVTSQFIQIARLRNYVAELSKVNKELKEKKKYIENMAYYDSLTGIHNRTFFYKLAEKYLESAKRSGGILGVMFIDVDKFKEINDTYGHEAGDKALVQVANILTQVIRKDDTVARYGGDEFLILLPHLLAAHNYEIIASRIRNHPDRFINLTGEKVEISLSIGISFYPADGDSLNRLIAKADQAMYLAKSRIKTACR